MYSRCGRIRALVFFIHHNMSAGDETFMCVMGWWWWPWQAYMRSAIPQYSLYITYTLLKNIRFNLLHFFIRFVCFLYYVCRASAARSHHDARWPSLAIAYIKWRKIFIIVMWTTTASTGTAQKSYCNRIASNEFPCINEFITCALRSHKNKQK